MMSRFSCYLRLSLAVAVLCASKQVRCAEDKAYLKAKPAAIETWKDWRFGMFLCWGPVTLTGEEIGWSRGMGARGMRPGLRGNRGKIPAAVYDELYQKWKPDRFDAEHWVKVAKDAGQRYLIYLVKHHDGFCLYDSKFTDYKSTGPKSAWKVDTLRAVADACHKHDLKLIIYYSQPDWHHPDYLTENHERYIQYLHEQVRELLTNYGKIDGLWFDNLRGRGDNPAAARLWEAERLFKMARGLQPDLVINDRCGLDGDFYTPEQHVGQFNRDRPWESCITLGTQWAWKPDDHLKSYEEAIRMLVVCATGNGNLALNTNPMPDGRIEPRQVESFKQLGKWMRANGESIYRTRGGPFVAPDAKTPRFGDARHRFPLPGGYWWGGSTHRGRTVFLHILRWPSDTIRLGAINRKLVSASLLNGGAAGVKQTSDGVTVSVPKDKRHPLDTIVKLEFDRPVGDVAPVKCPGFKAVNYQVDERKQADGNSLLEVHGPAGKVTRTYPIQLIPHHSPATEMNDPVIREWLKWKYGAFVCFNSNQFTGKEFCDMQNPAVYAPPTLDVKQWISTFKQAGMNYGVLTARHTSGFLLWDSATTNFDVAFSGNATDVVRVYVNECREQGMAPGIYYCLWGGKNCGPSGGKERPEARAMILAQLYELATRYGSIPYFWIDMMNWAQPISPRRRSTTC